MNKKILISGVVSLMLLLLIVAPVLAVKPTGNLAGAEEVAWNLSADVMPVPPYGSRDIPDSDTLSKLIVNQPNGNTEVVLNGVMKGLNPNTEYTVFLSNDYTPYEFLSWDVSGEYDITVELYGADYYEEMELVQVGSAITGLYLRLLNGTSPWTVTGGSVNGNNIDFDLSCDFCTLEAQFTGTIAPNGSMSGTWADVAPGIRSGSWATTSGAATDHAGDTGWSGLFTPTVQPFTFTTDEFGSGNWHLNLRDEDFSGPGTYTLSVWINESGGTMLISDNFQVVVD